MTSVSNAVGEGGSQSDSDAAKLMYVVLSSTFADALKAPPLVEDPEAESPAGNDQVSGVAARSIAMAVTGFGA